jgi:hypothetical protein
MAKPTNAFCQGTYDQLVFNGFPNAAKQMAGEPNDNAAFLAEKKQIPPALIQDMQDCAGLAAEQIIAQDVAKMTPEERKQARAIAAKALQEHIDAKGGKGYGVVQDPGTLSSHAAYEEIIEAIDEADALASPFGFLMGDGLLGIPKAVWYVGGAFILYKALTGGARSYARARGSR